jgi:hypothetical protein
MTRIFLSLFGLLFSPSCLAADPVGGVLLDGEVNTALLPIIIVCTFPSIGLLLFLYGLFAQRTKLYYSGLALFLLSLAMACWVVF